MNRLKVATILGTRPEIIRLSRVISKLEERCEHVLVHTGQNYDVELNEVFFRELELPKPKYFLQAAGATAAETIGTTISRVDAVLAEQRPDAVLILGDTNSCLSAIAAKKRRVPIFHMEAGNRCFDERVPEEANRRVVDHLADVNLPYSSIAREYLLREGIPPDRVIKTGSPMYEVLSYYRPGIDRSDVLARLRLVPKEYYVVSCHREENVEPEAAFTAFVDTLRELATSRRMPVIVSVHPRTRKRIETAGVTMPESVRLLRPLGFLDYVALEVNARCTLSDSGTITEESSILDFPAINLREAHERPEGMEEAPVIMTGLRWLRVEQALEILEHQVKGGKRTLRLVADYDVPNVSEKVVRIILSYVDYVKRVVWQGCTW